METDDILKTKLIQETAQFPWKELLRHFAAGTVIAVSPELDLIEAALQVTKDNKEAVTRWLTSGDLAKVSDLQAKAWLDDNASLWTVVVRPWILVQHRKPPAEDTKNRVLH
ncbi:DUF2288 domain-containing protein [Undibacterium terreum]|uniref:DUF2288 domain-containing protein n=1 Tax=Undibacterium terreum TaxID=1224302 RepID=A0A916UZK6_9BURK|nr:DUF2288 domain-containing protein [Undibacterium terreum]GGC96863.1 hypothetical protein GCM10011396_50390 [Undibacterium terreum]